MTDITELARERLKKIKSWRETYGAGSNVMLPAEEAEELARMALAAMDSEPVVKKVACWSCQNEVEIAAISDCDGCCPKCGTRIHLDEEPYIAPLSAPDRDQVRQEHAEWSQATFGNVGPVGPLKHLRKEALEAAAEPDDLSEWADMQFLLWDAQRRAGITDEQITQAMIDKLAVNKARQWPEPKDGEPRMHLRSEDESLNARRRRNRESNARARERETPAQRKARLEKNRLRMALRRKGGAK